MLLKTRLGDPFAQPSTLVGVVLGQGGEFRKRDLRKLTFSK